MEKFTKENLVGIRKAVEAKLKDLSNAYGIEFKMKGITFNAFKFSSKIEVSIPGKVIDYSEKYPFMNLPKIGQKFIVNQKVFEVIEHAINRPKFPVIAKDEVNKKYKFSATVVNQLLKK